MKFNPPLDWIVMLPIIFILSALAVLCIVMAIRQREKTNVWVRRSSIVILLLPMVAGVSLPGGNGPSGMLNLDVIYAIDTTTSMNGEDYNGNKPRINGVISDIKQLSEKMAGARFSIISFDSVARTNMPMTSDSSTLRTILGTSLIEVSNHSRGSSIDMPIDLIKKQIEKNKKMNPTRPNLLFYLGDGEQTAEQDPKSFSELRKLISGGGVFGYGTSAGGKMKVFSGFTGLDSCDGFSSQCYVKDLTDFSQPDALTKIDEKNLRKIASELGVEYTNRNDASSIDDVFDPGKVEIIANNSRKVSNYINLSWLFALPVGLLLLFELYGHLAVARKLKGPEDRI